LVGDVVLDDLVGEDELEALLSGREVVDVCDEAVGPLGAGVPVGSEYLGEEAGLPFFLADCAVIVVDLVLVDADDALLLHPHVVHFHHRKLFVQGGFAQADRQGGSGWWKWGLLLLEESETAYDFGAVSALKLTLIDVSLGLDLGRGRST
jgi:hypothetical protein